MLVPEQRAVSCWQQKVSCAGCVHVCVFCPAWLVNPCMRLTGWHTMPVGAGQAHTFARPLLRTVWVVGGLGGLPLPWTAATDLSIVRCKMCRMFGDLLRCLHVHSRKERKHQVSVPSGGGLLQLQFYTPPPTNIDTCSACHAVCAFMQAMHMSQPNQQQ